MNTKVLFFSIFSIVFSITFGLLALNYNSHSNTYGSYIVKLMYNYDTVEDFGENYEKLAGLMTEDAYKKINIDDPIRVVNAYYKMKGDRTRVHILKEVPNIVFYQLENDNIDRREVWVLRYKEEGGLITDIKEYRFLKIRNEGRGVL